MVIRSRRGFTLIELLVVIAIIALLLAIVVPSLAKAKDFVKRIICMNNIRQCGMAVHNYAQSYKQAVVPNYKVNTDTLYDLNDTSHQPHNSYRVYTPEQTTPAGSPRPYKPYHLAVFYELGLIDTPKIFYCPAQPPTTTNYRIPYYYEFYIGEGNSSDYNASFTRRGFQWGTVLPLDTRVGSGVCRTSFNYWVYGKKKLTEINGYKPIIFDNIQAWEAVPHRKGRGINSAPQGLSALYADGHAAFNNDLKIFDDTNNWPWNIIGPEYDDGPGNNTAMFQEILRRLQAH